MNQQEIIAQACGPAQLLRAVEHFCGYCFCFATPSFPLSLLSLSQQEAAPWKPVKVTSPTPNKWVILVEDLWIKAKVCLHYSAYY